MRLVESTDSSARSIEHTFNPQRSLTKSNKYEIFSRSSKRVLK
jgi:hypothetical protein